MKEIGAATSENQAVISLLLCKGLAVGTKVWK